MMGMNNEPSDAGRNHQPRFIVIEGIDGSGKTTLCRHLRGGALAAPVVKEKFRDPGTTPVGEILRTIVVNESGNPLFRDLSPQTEALLFCAAGSQLAYQKIKPALDAGFTVVQDRWRLSTIVYQGALALKGIPNAAEILADVCNKFEPVQPDVCILLEVDPMRAHKRIMTNQGRGVDRFEGRGPEYLEDLAREYSRVAHFDQGAFPYPIEVVNANGAEREVVSAVCSLLKDKYGIPFNRDYLFSL